MEDLECLSEFLLGKLAQKFGRTKPNVKPDDWRVLEAYDFPGNVRELRNLLERSLLQTPPEGNWLEMDRAWLRKNAPDGASSLGG